MLKDWKFVQISSGEWVWQRLNERGYVREYSASAFQTRAECEADAARFGYSRTPVHARDWEFSGSAASCEPDSEGNAARTLRTGKVH